jgi:hypothetical protein
MDGVSFRIHIAVVGFEIDRISLAAIEMKADKIYLITKKNTKNDPDKGLYYLEENKKILKNAGIQVEVEFIDRVHDLGLILSSTKKIIEIEKNNHIFINISSGSNLSAIAGTIVSMMYNNDYHITPYYVKPQTYTEPNLNQPITSGIEKIYDVLTFPAKIPDQRLIEVLNLIKSSKKVDSDGKKYVTKKDLIIHFKKYLDELNKRFIEEKKETPTPEQEKAKSYAWLNQNIVNKLKNEWDMIEIKNEGKYSQIRLTKKGENMLEYLT